MKPALNDCTWAAAMPELIQPHHPPVSTPAAASCSGVPMGMPRKVVAWLVMARSTFRAANRLSEVPACSKRVQKTTAPKISTVASIIRWRSSLVWQIRRIT